jgi:acetyl esterase
MKFTSSTITRSALLCFSMAALLSCNKAKEETPEKEMNDSIVKENKDVRLEPKGPAPEWGKNIKPEMAVVIEKLASLGGKPIETLTAEEARKQPTPTDAVMGVMKDQRIVMPNALCDTIGKQIPVTGGTTHVRIYTPKQGKAPFPVIVYYHGGGFVIANINVYNGGAQGLCEQTGAIVVSVEYPKGPEKKYRSL